MEGLNMKRLISIVIAFCLLLSSIVYAAPTSDQSDNESENETPANAVYASSTEAVSAQNEGTANIEYSPEGDFIVDENGVITNYMGSDENVNVPPTINGKKIVSIGKNAFPNITIKTVILPDGVTSIGGSAFYHSSLTSITIPDSVTSIGDRAFSYCRSLTNITIPNSVTSIGEGTFSYCSSLTSITIPDSVTSIGDRAFSYCSSLTNITIPDSVTSIGSYAFDCCSSLTSITIPDSVTSIESYAFWSCSSLTSITIPDSVTSIGEGTFKSCSSLTSITIPDSVTSIGSSAFDWCSKLTSITIPDSVTSIGDYAFRECSSLTSITIPDSVTSIGRGAFSYCSSLTSINVNKNNKDYANINGVLFNKTKTTLIAYPGKLSGAYIIPDSVTSIGDYAFSYCSSLTSITIPDSVTSIGEYAFYGCSSLTSITIPDSVTSIGDYAFRGCSSLTSITIPDSVTSIGEQAFHSCSSLTSITIPDSVTSIVRGAFAYCSSLTSITIPDSVTSIGEYAFGDCSSLTSITIPDSATSIEDSAFEGCSSLSSAYFEGNAPTTFGTDVFKDCASDFTIYYYKGAEGFTTPEWNGYKTIELDRNSGELSTEATTETTTEAFTETTIEDTTDIEYSPESDFEVDENGVITKYKGHDENVNVPPVINGKNIIGIGERAFYQNETIKTVILPDGVTSIGEDAFGGCSSLTSITIPNKITSIGEWAFGGCSSLTSITIPDSVTSIGNSAFIGCSSLTNINVNENNKNYASINGVLFNKTKTTLIECPGGLESTYIIPDSVTSIGRVAFEYCSKLTNITIPDSVTSIGDCAFYYCNSLTSMIIPDSVTSIEYCAFWQCSSLKSITIPNSVTSIGSFAFGGCSSLTNITIPDSVTSIGDRAFDSCSSLTSITIPDSVTSIGSCVFNCCSSLTSITIPDSVTSIESGAFNCCSSLTSITIPDSVTSIGDRAFSYCRSLSSTYFEGNAPTTFGTDVFKDCASDFTIYYYEGAKGFTTPKWNGYNTVMLSKDNSNFERLNIYNQNEVETKEFEYGDRITVEAKPKLREKSAATDTVTNVSVSDFVEPKANQMALFMNGTQITGVVLADSDGIYTMIVDTTEDFFKIGENVITVKYVGDDNTADCIEDISIIIRKKSVELAGVSAENAEYDGTPKKGYYGEPKNDFYTGEYVIKYTGRNNTKYDSADAPVSAGDYTVTFSIPDNENYVGSISVDFSILKAKTEFDGDIKVYDRKNKETNEFIYGDKIVVEVSTNTISLAAVRASEFAPPGEKQMALFMGNKQISGSVAENNGVYRMSVYSNEDGFVIGQNILTVKYVGNENTSDYAENVYVTVNEKELIVTGVVAENSVYDGTAKKGYIGEPKSSLYSGEYEISYTGKNNTSYNSKEAPTEVGDYTVTIRIPESANYYVGEISLDFNILKEKSKFAELKTYNSDNKESKQFAYGDIISVKATPVLTGEAAVSLASFAEPADKQMALYIGNKQISEAANPDKNGVYTMLADTMSDGFVIGQNLITAKYVGDSNTEGCSEDVMIVLTKRGVKITGINSVKTAKYSNSAVTGYTGEPTVDVYGGYDGEYEISYSGRNDTVYSSSEAPSEVGDYTVTIKIPENADYYEGETSIDFSVAKKEISISGVSSAGNYDYDGTAKIGYNGIPASEYTGEYEISYSGIGNTSYSGEYAPTEVGQYKVTIKIPDDSNYMGEISFNFEILEQPDDGDDNTNEDNSEKTSGETNTEQPSENQTEDNSEKTSGETNTEQPSENQTEDNSEETSEETDTEQSSENQTEDNSEETSGKTDIEQPSENGTEQSSDETSTEENSDILIGDVDGNGRLEINDASLMLQYVLDKRNILSIKRRENFIEDMDVDGNGQITATDCACILKKVLDNTFAFPIEK